MSPYPPPPWRWCRRFDSLEGLRGALTSDAIQVAASGPGAFGATLSVADLGALHLVAGSFSVATVTSGFTSADELSLSIVLESAGGSLNGVPLEPGTAVVFRPGTLFEAWSGPGYRFVSLSLARPAARALAQELGWRLPDAPGTGVLVARLRAPDLATLRELTERLGLWTPTPPVGIDAEVGGAAVGVWARILGEVWSAAAPHAVPQRKRAGVAALKRVHAYLKAHLSEEINSADLCRAARAKARSLQTWCREHFGITPVHYVMVQRLHAVRVALRRADDPPATIATAARGAGFRHLGRFAAAYRRVFGEAPTQSRRKPRPWGP